MGDTRVLGRPISRELQYTILEQTNAWTMEVKIGTDTALRMVLGGQVLVLGGQVLVLGGQVLVNIPAFLDPLPWSVTDSMDGPSVVQGTGHENVFRVQFNYVHARHLIIIVQKILNLCRPTIT